MDMEKYFKTSGIKGSVQQVIAAGTATALTAFCAQEPEFAQAVEQSGRSFQDCLDSVAKGVSRSLSDFDAYSKAAAFYFPGAKIEFRMLIHLAGDADRPEPVPEKSTLQLDFESLLDF